VEDENWIKALKRMWNLAVFIRDAHTIAKLLPFFQCGVGLLYQLKSDVATLKKYITKHTNPRKDLPSIMDFLKNIREKTGTEFEVEIQEIENNLKNRKVGKASDNFQFLEDILYDLVNKNTLQYMKEHGVDPVQYITALGYYNPNTGCIIKEKCSPPPEVSPKVKCN
jgi:hypothetical protein